MLYSDMYIQVIPYLVIIEVQSFTTALSHVTAVTCQSSDVPVRRARRVDRRQHRIHTYDSYISFSIIILFSEWR